MTRWTSPNLSMMVRRCWTPKCLERVAVAFAGLILSLCICEARADEYTPDSSGERLWVGPEAWARPMQHWRVADASLVARPTLDGSVHLMPCTLSGAGTIVAEATVELTRMSIEVESSRAGFWLGTRGAVDDWRHRAVYAEGGVRLGVDHLGRAFIDDQVSDGAVSLDHPVRVTATYDPALALLKIVARAGGDEVEQSRSISPEAMAGGAALLAEAPARTASADPEGQLWRFREVRLSGPGLQVDPDRTFGPILWTQYTLSDATLKLMAQLPPVGPADESHAALWLERDRQWVHALDAEIDPDAKTALFRIDGWDGAADTRYRVVYRSRGREHTWDGTIRAEPLDATDFTLAALSCDHGYAFPQPQLVLDVKRQNPDLLFFAGDQIYERFAMHGIQRSPVDVATLDYLRKFYLFGWTWRDLLRDRPSVVLPDDHDVFQGNLYGMAGRPTPKGEDFDYGGYVMPPRWVNMVQRTQTGHLPDAIDPTPTDSGIDVYFTAMGYGGLRFAILEDRKFKSGGGFIRDRRKIDRPWSQLSAAELDFPEAELLGDRQLSFLREWSKDSGGDEINVVLTQTMFASVHTHSGPKLRFNGGLDVDTNGWPRSPRDEALRAMETARPVLICGDQHLGALVQHGIETWDDGPLQFMVTGSANGWPRAFWPGSPVDAPERVDGDGLGPYTDPFGNRLTVLGVANPAAGVLKPGNTDPEELAAVKGSGYGLVRFDKKARRVTFDQLRYPMNGQPAESFDGFPVSLSMPSSE